MLKLLYAIKWSLSSHTIYQKCFYFIVYFRLAIFFSFHLVLKKNVKELVFYSKELSL